jgi:hypothetical protein
MGGFVFAALSASRAYVGLGTLSLCCEETKDPRVTVPWAMVASVVTIFFTQLIVTITSCAHEPGVDQLLLSPYPLMHGFATSFGIHSSQGMILSLVAVYAACFGYAYSYGRLMCSLSRSGFLPSIGSIVYGERQSPIAAMVGGNLLVFCVMLVLYYYDYEERAVYASGTLASLVIYASIFVSFIVFRYRFTTLQKTLVNPFGVPSAIVGLIIFTIPAIYVCGYMDVNLAASMIFIVLVFLISIPYYFRISSTQSYSEEEQSVLLVLYVMTANRTRNKRNRNKAKASFALNNKGTHASKPTVSRSSNTTYLTNIPSNNFPQIQAPPSRIYSCLPSYFNNYFSTFSTPSSFSTTVSATPGFSNGRRTEEGVELAATGGSAASSGTASQLLKPLRSFISSKNNLQVIHPTGSTAITNTELTSTEEVATSGELFLADSSYIEQELLKVAEQEQDDQEAHQRTVRTVIEEQSRLIRNSSEYSTEQKRTEDGVDGELHMQHLPSHGAVTVDIPVDFTAAKFGGPAS